MTFIKKLRQKIFKSADENRKRDLTFLSVLFGVFAFNFFLFLGIHGGDIKAGFTKMFAKENYDETSITDPSVGGTIDDFYVYSTVSCGDNSQVFYNENGAKVGSTCSVWTTSPAQEISFNGGEVNKDFWETIAEWFKSIQLYGVKGNKTSGYIFTKENGQTYNYNQKGSFFDAEMNKKFMYSTSADTLDLYKVFGWTSQWTPSGLNAHFFSTSPWTSSNYITGEQIRWNRTEATVGNVANRIYQYFPNWEPYSDVFYLTAHDLEQFLSGPKNTDSSIYVKISDEEFNRFYRVSLYPTFEKTGTGVWSSLSEAVLNDTIGKIDYTDYYQSTKNYRTIYQLQQSTIRYSTTTKDGEQLENLFSGFAVSQNGDGKFVISDAAFSGQTFDSENEAKVAWLTTKHPGSTTSYYKGGENGGYFIFKAESELRNFPHFEVYQDNGSTQSWKNDNAVFAGTKEDASTFRYYLDSNGFSVALSESEAENDYVKLQKYWSEQISENYYYYDTTTGYGNPSILKNTDTKTYVWEDWYEYTVTYDVYIASTYENAEFVNDASNAFYAADKPAPSEKDYVFYKVTNASLFELKFYNLVYTKGNTWAVANGTADRINKSGSDYYVEKYMTKTNNGDKVMKNYAQLFWDNVGGSGYFFKDFTRNTNTNGILDLNQNGISYSLNDYAYSMQQSDYKLYKVIMPFWTLNFKSSLTIPSTTNSSQLATYLNRNASTGTFGDAFVVSTTSNTATNKVSFVIDGKTYVSTNSTITKFNSSNEAITCYVFKVAGTNDYAYFKVDEISLDTMDFEMALYKWAYTSTSTLFCYDKANEDLAPVSLANLTSLTSGSTMTAAQLATAAATSGINFSGTNLDELFLMAGVSSVSYRTLNNKNCYISDANDRAANKANAIYGELEYSEDGFNASSYTGHYFSEFIQIDTDYFKFESEENATNTAALQFPSENTTTGYWTTQTTSLHGTHIFNDKYTYTVKWGGNQYKLKAKYTASSTITANSAILFPESSYTGISRFEKDGYYYTLMGFRKYVDEGDAIIWRYIRSADGYVMAVTYDGKVEECGEIEYGILNKSTSILSKIVDDDYYYVTINFHYDVPTLYSGALRPKITVGTVTNPKICEILGTCSSGGSTATAYSYDLDVSPSKKGYLSTSNSVAPVEIYSGVYAAVASNVARSQGWFSDYTLIISAKSTKPCRPKKGEFDDESSDKITYTCKTPYTYWRFFTGNNYIRYAQGRFSLSTGKLASYTGTAFHTQESANHLLDLSSVSTSSTLTNLNTYSSTFVRNVLVQQIGIYGGNTSYGWRYAFDSENGTSILATKTYTNNDSTSSGSAAYFNAYYGGSAIAISDADENTLAGGFEAKQIAKTSVDNSTSLLLTLYLTEQNSTAKIGYIKQTNNGESSTLANGSDKLFHFTRYSEQYDLIYDKNLLPSNYNVSIADGGSGLVLNADGNYFSEYYTYGPDTITPVGEVHKDLVLSTDYFSISSVTSLNGYRILTLTNNKLKDSCSTMNNVQTNLDAFNALYKVGQSSYATIENASATTSGTDLINLFKNSTNLSAKNGLSAVLAPSTKNNKTGYYLQTFQLKKVNLELGTPVNYTETVLLGDSYSMNNWYSIDENGNATLTPQSNELYIGNYNDSSYSSSLAENVTNTLSITKDGTTSKKYFIYTDGKTNIPYVVSYKVTLGTEETKKFYGNLSSSETFSINYSTGKLTQTGSSNGFFTNFVVPGSINRGNSGGTTISITSSTGYSLPNGQSAVGSNVSFNISSVSGGASSFTTQNICTTANIINGFDGSISCKVLDEDISQNHNVTAQSRKDLYLKYNQPDSFKEWVLRVDDASTTVNESQISYNGIFGSSFTAEKKNEANIKATNDGYLVLGYGALNGVSSVGSVSYNETTKGGFVVFNNEANSRLYSLVERHNASQTIKTWYANDKLADTWNGSNYVLNRRNSITSNNIFDMNSWVKDLVTNSSNISISSNGKNRSANFELITHANAIGKYTFKFNSNTNVEREFDVTTNKNYVLSIKTTSTTGTVNVSITSGTESKSGTLSGSNRTDIAFTAKSDKAKIRISGSTGALAEVEWISVQEGTTFSYYAPYGTNYSGSQINYQQNGVSGEKYRKYVSKREARSWSYVSYNGQYLNHQDDYLGQFHTEMGESYQFVTVLGNPSNFNMSVINEMLENESDNFIAVSGKPNTTSGGTLPTRISAADTDDYRLVAINYDGNDLYETNYAKFELKIYLGLFFYKDGILEDSTSTAYTRYLKSTDVDEFENQNFTYSNPIRNGALITYSYADAVLYNPTGSNKLISDPSENLYTSLVNYTEDGATHVYIADVISQASNQGRIYQYGNNSLRIFRETGVNVDRTQSVFYKTQIYKDQNDKDAGEGWVDITRTFNFGPTDFDFRDGAGDKYNYQKEWTLVIKGKLARAIDNLYIIGEGKTFEGEDKNKAVGGDTVYLTIETDGHLTIRNAILSQDEGRLLSIYSFEQAYVKINGNLVPATVSNINQVSEIYGSNTPGAKPIIVECVPFIYKTDNTKNFTSNQGSPQTIAFYDEIRILIGDGEPTNDIGRNGISYLDTTNNKRYIKQDGIWTFVDVIDTSKIIYNDFELAKSGYKIKDLEQNGSTVTFTDTTAQQETDRGFWVSNSEATFYSTNIQVYGASWQTRNVYGNEIGSNSFYYETDDYGYLIIPGKKIIVYDLELVGRTSFAVTSKDREIPYLKNGSVNPEYSAIAQAFGGFDYGMVGESEHYILIKPNGESYKESGQEVQFMTYEAAQNYINAWKATKPEFASYTIRKIINNAVEIPYLRDENGTEYGSHKSQYTFSNRIYGDFYDFGSTYALTNESINLYYAIYKDDKGNTKFEYYWGNSDTRLNQIVGFLQSDFYYYNTNSGSAAYSYTIYVPENGNSKNYYFMDEDGKLYNTQSHFVSFDTLETEDGTGIPETELVCINAETGEAIDCADYNITEDDIPSTENGYMVTSLIEVSYVNEYGKLRITSGETIGDVVVSTGRTAYYDENGVLLNSVVSGCLSYSEIELHVRSATSEETIYDNYMELSLMQDDGTTKTENLTINTYFENQGKTLFKWELQMANSNYAVVNMNNYFSEGEGGGGFYTRRFDESTGTVYSDPVSQLDFSGSSSVRTDAIGLSGGIGASKADIITSTIQYFLNIVTGVREPLLSILMSPPGENGAVKNRQVYFIDVILNSYGAGDSFSTVVNGVSLTGATSPTNAVALVPKTILSKMRSSDAYKSNLATKILSFDALGHRASMGNVVISFMDLEYGRDRNNYGFAVNSSLNKKTAGLYETHLLGGEYESSAWSEEKYGGAVFKEVIPEYILFNNSTIEVDYAVKGVSASHQEYGSYHGLLHPYYTASDLNYSTSWVDTEDNLNLLSTDKKSNKQHQQEFSYSMAFLYAYYDVENPGKFTLYKQRLVNLANKVTKLYKGYQSWKKAGECSLGGFIEGIGDYARNNSAAYSIVGSDTWLLTSEGLIEVFNSSYFSWEESGSSLNYSSKGIMSSNLLVDIEFKGLVPVQLWNMWQNAAGYSNMLYSDMSYKVAKDQNGNLIVKIYKNAREGNSQMKLMEDAIKTSTDANYCTTLYIVQKDNMIYVYVELQDTDYIQVSSGIFESQSLVATRGKNVSYKIYSSFFNDHSFSGKKTVNQDDYDDPTQEYSEFGENYLNDRIRCEWRYWTKTVWGITIKIPYLYFWTENIGSKRWTWKWTGDHPGSPYVTLPPTPAGEFDSKEIASYKVAKHLGQNGKVDLYAVTIPLNMYIPITSSRYKDPNANYEDERWDNYVMMDLAVANADRDVNDYLKKTSETYKGSNKPTMYFNRQTLVYRDLNLLSVNLGWPAYLYSFVNFLNENKIRVYETNTYSKILYRSLGDKLNGKTAWSIYTSTSGHVIFRDDNGNLYIPHFSEPGSTSKIADYQVGGGGLKASKVHATIDEPNSKFTGDTDGKTHTTNIYGTDFKVKINISNIDYPSNSSSKVNVYEQNYEYAVYITEYNGKAINELSEEEITILASLGYNQIRKIRETGGTNEITVAYYSGTVTESYKNNKPNKTVNLSYVFRDKVNPEKVTDGNGNDVKLSDGRFWYSSSYYLSGITINNLLPSTTYKITIRMRYINSKTSEVKTFTIHTGDDMVYTPWGPYLYALRKTDGYYQDAPWRGNKDGLITREMKDQFYTYSIKYNDELFLKTGGVIKIGDNYYADKVTNRFYGDYFEYDMSTNKFKTNKYDFGGKPAGDFHAYRLIEDTALKPDANKTYISNKKAILILSDEEARSKLSYDYYKNITEAKAKEDGIRGHKNNIPDVYRYRYYNSGQKPITAFISLHKDGATANFTQTNLYLNFEKKLGEDSTKYSIKQKTNGYFEVSLVDTNAEKLGLKQAYEDYIDYEWKEVVTLDSLQEGFDPLNNVILNRANWNIYLSGGQEDYAGYKFDIHAYYRFSASYEVLYLDLSRVLNKASNPGLEDDLFEKGSIVYTVTTDGPLTNNKYSGSINHLLSTGFDDKSMLIDPSAATCPDCNAKIATFYDYWGLSVNNGVHTNETTNYVALKTLSEFDANNAQGKQKGERQRKTVAFTRNDIVVYYLCEIDENGNTIGILV